MKKLIRNSKCKCPYVPIFICEKRLALLNIEQCTIVHCTLGHVNITIIKPTTIHPIAPPKKTITEWAVALTVCVLYVCFVALVPPLQPQ